MTLGNAFTHGHPTDTHSQKTELGGGGGADLRGRQGVLAPVHLHGVGVFKAHRLVFRSTPGLRVITEKRSTLNQRVLAPAHLQAFSI